MSRPRLVHALTARASLALLLALPLTARAITTWVASSTEKIRPFTPPRVSAPAALTAARNEFEAFQLAVVGAASGVSAAATPLTGPGTIPAPRLHREAILSLAYASAVDGAVGDFPDPLVPDVDDIDGQKRNAFPFDVPAGQTRVIWAEVHVPDDAKPGVYQGTVVVRAAGEADVTIPVSLTVYDFALPSTSSLKSHFALYYADLLSGHGVTGEAMAELRSRYVRAGLDHRVTVGGVDDGNFDLAHVAQYYGPYLDGTGPTQLRGARMTSYQYMGSMHTGTDASQIATYSAWARFFDARGWLDRLFDYTCDEPPLTCQWSQIPQRASLVRQGDPRIRTLLTTTVQEASDPAHDVRSSVDIIVPVVNQMNDRPGNGPFAGPQRAAYDAFLASGSRKELWMYQSCMSHGCGGFVDVGNPTADQLYWTGWPSYMIDAEALRARAMEWLSFAYRATGELYWDTGYAFQGGDPWKDQWRFSGNGDGTLFYPGTPAKIGGTTHVPVASLRLKMLREGMEDFEYLKLLSDAGDPALANQLAAQLFPNPWTEPKVSDLLTARETIARRILELTGRLGGQDPVAVTPPPIGTPPSQDAPLAATDPSLAPASRSLAGSGCSAGAAAELVAGLGLAAALLLRRRRRT